MSHPCQDSQRPGIGVSGVRGPFPPPDNPAIVEGDKAAGKQAVGELSSSGQALHIPGCCQPERMDQHQLPGPVGMGTRREMRGWGKRFPPILGTVSPFHQEKKGYLFSCCNSQGEAGTTGDISKDPVFLQTWSPEKCFAPGQSQGLLSSDFISSLPFALS